MLIGLLRDVLALVGVVMIVAGLWLISPAVALVTIGALFLAAALFVGRHHPTPPPHGGSLAP